MTIKNLKSKQVKNVPLSAGHQNFSFCSLNFTFNQVFPLIETIVAMGVILAATVGPLALVTSGIADFAYTKNKLIAVNLAQEGVELTRSVRDDNTLCDTINGAPVWPWNRDPQSGGTFVNFVGEISIDQTMNIDCGIGTYQGNPVVIKVPLLPPDGCINKLRLDTTTGIYGHNGDKETIFSRCVQIMVPPVCIDQDAPDATCPDSDVLLSDQMEIISTVIWSEKGRQNTAVLRERIYNWK